MINEKLHRMLVEIFGEEYDVRSDQFRINCINPECGDTSGNLEISLEKGICHCWKCHYSGTVRQLIKDYLGWVPKIDKYVSAESLKRKSIVQPDNIKKNFWEKSKLLPKEFIPLWENLDKLSTPGKYALKYIRGRLTDDEIKFYHIGYCGLGKYRNRIIVPVMENNQVVYFVARTFVGEDPKYRNPESKDFGIGKEKIIFNINGAAEVGQAVICEGVFDAINVGHDGVAIFGTQLSDFQLFKMVAHGIKKFVICLDKDAYEIALKISGERKGDSKYFGYDVRLVKIDKKDPALMSRDVLRHKISEAKPFERHNEFLQI